MNAQQLKNAILQEAIEGRLVPQDPNDEPASALLARIHKEKEQLVKAGKLKKKDLEVKPISEDEIPFEIPESWEWCRVKSISFKIVDGDHNPPKGLSCDSGYYMLSSKNVNNDGLVELDSVRYLSYEDWEKCNERTSLKKGDVLLTTVGTLGRSCVYEGDIPYCFQRSVSIIQTFVFNYYLKYSFDCPFFQSLIDDKATGTAQRGFYLNQLEDAIIPLPPLAEQKRIVAKIEELLPKVEEYGKAQEALDKLNAELPERLKKSILQEAITGRLVPQDPNDEPASVLLDKIRKEKAKLVKEKKIILSKPEKACIIKEDGEFSLPQNWRWGMINDICRVFGRIGFRGYTKNDLRYSQEDAAISISPSNMINGTMDFSNCTYISEEKYEESPEIKIQNGDILIVKTGSSYGKTSLVENLPWKSTINPQIAVVKDIKINKHFLVYFFQSPYAQSKFKNFVLGTSIPTFSQLNLISMQIPLPPLAEQKRIVAKIEEVFKEIDKLKNNG